MADLNNFSDINENFDTIKTLLNSIRAQGILNTSDVDKLLEGINSKLEKINTEEDIDLIKAFLSELKQNLDERHNILLSKFGAIESLFSNLLKNSNETVKSAELKELFDIVATNLSVFSREVVSHKETLTDITLRLDALRSDETQKKEIIKSISFVRNDIEKVSNGFDSIVISLNENFKTVLKTISEIDQSDAIKGFTDQLNDIINSSNAILSAIQLIDKKNDQFDGALEGLATQEDTAKIQKDLLELNAKSEELSSLVDSLTQKSYKIDNLSDKIDAAVNIIAGLKTEISDKDNESKNEIIERLSELEKLISEVKSDEEFQEFKKSLQMFLTDLSGSSEQLKQSLEQTISRLDNISQDVKGLDINANLESLSSGLDRVIRGVEKINDEVNSQELDSLSQKMISGITGTGEDVKEKVASESDKISQLMDVNVTRTLNDISSNAEVLNARIKESHTVLAELCEKNFAEVSENVTGLKEIVSQLDENNVSANNAIFSNITDRLSIFENSLKSSLEKQEDFVSSSSKNLVEQILSIKNVSENIDYKLDNSSIEMTGAKKSYEELKSSVDNLLALDFVNVVKDLKVDLYAVKQDLAEAAENSENEITEKITNDVFRKYELLISKLETTEDEIKHAQTDALTSINSVLSNISDSIVDVLSYVSSAKENNNEKIEAELKTVIESIKDNNLNYIEDVRDVVDVIRQQVENNLAQISQESDSRFKGITSAISQSNMSIKTEIQKSYDKILQVYDNFDSIKEILNVNNLTLSTNISDAITASENLKGDFEQKISSLKKTLLDKVTEFKNEFTYANADKISELKFNSESLHAKSIQNSIDLNNELKTELDSIIKSLKQNIDELNENIASTALKIEGANKEVIDFVKNDFTLDINNSVDNIRSTTGEVLAEMDNNVSGVVKSFNSLESSVNNLSYEMTSSLSSTLGKILENFISLETLIKSLNEHTLDNVTKISDEMRSDFSSMEEKYEINKNITDCHLDHQTSVIKENHAALETLIKSLDEESKKNFETAVQEINIEINLLKRKLTEVDNAVDADLAHQISIIEGSFESLNLMLVDIMNQTKETLGDKIKHELSGVSFKMSEALEAELEQYKTQIEDLFDEHHNQNDKQADFIKERVLELNSILETTLARQSSENEMQLDSISNNLKQILSENLELSAADYQTLKANLESFFVKVSQENDDFVNSIKTQLDEIAKFVDSNIDIQAQQINTMFENISSNIQKIDESIENSGDELGSKIDLLQVSAENLNTNVITNVKNELQELKGRINALFEESSINYVTQLGNVNTELSDEINNSAAELKNALEQLNQRLNTDEISRKNLYQAQLHEITATFNDLIESSKTLTKSELASISDVLISNSQSAMDEVKDSIDEKINSLLVSSADISAGELQTIDAYATSILDKIESVKQNSIVCKDLILKLINEHFNSISANIEKETDVIVGDIVEQFGILKDSQKDEFSALTNALEGSVAGYIIDAVNDLKSYLDIRTDKADMNAKLDNLKLELEKSFENTAGNINKLLEVSIFNDAITDLRAANEVLVTSVSEKLNDQIREFVRENVSKKLEDKINLFDKKFTDTVVDKYEEVKLLSSQYNKSFENISGSVNDLVSKFISAKDEINSNLNSVLQGINGSIDALQESFNELKAQILNKSFDEAFHASVHNQISGIESLVKEQLGYIEDISDLCCSNMPEIAEMSAAVKYGIQGTLSDIKEKVNNQDANIADELNSLKSEIITQFINIFNQISFVAEQEEILDFIQEKHSELITILSHIVTTSDSIEDVKDNVAVVDNKIDSLKEDIELINEKITSIMSSDGDIDYVYSLQDLESDIANLRLVLNDMKADNKSKELDELINSTNNIYQLVEAIKSEMPKFEIEEFKKDFENLSEDIVSISTRTNKLLLASDESYKTLQENLQDFKLVINDLDERTRNFSHEAGIDRLDNKLAAINTMVQNGAKTNQVFNQVFEYLAEWVDKAGIQIASISDKVETLDDISQIKVMLQDLKAETEDKSETLDDIGKIKVMLEDLKAENEDKSETLDDIGRIRIMLEDLRAESQDNSDSAELVDALSLIFDKQAKRIASLEAKLDRLIVDATINSRSNKIDLSPMEDTLNKFLAAINDKMLIQQSKINSVEEKLAEVVSLVDNKDTAQLTKKVGGMDKQLAKLNKSIEKIASNVVEK